MMDKVIIIFLLVMCLCNNVTKVNNCINKSEFCKTIENGLSFDIEDNYKQGETMEVLLKNVTGRNLLYSSSFAACYLKYYDCTGMEFSIPPGTHCDIVIIDTIYNRQTVTLFKWNLTECTKDNWGCLEMEPLKSGIYKIEGLFYDVERSDSFTVSKCFKIE